MISEEINNALPFNIVDRTLIVNFLGNVFISSAEKFNQNTIKNIDLTTFDKVIFDYTEIEKYDMFLFVFNKELKEYFYQNNKTLSYRGKNEQISDFFEYLSKLPYSEIKNTKIKQNPIYNLISNLGEITQKLTKDFYLFLKFFGEILKGFAKLFYHIKAIRWSDFPTQLSAVGVSALPISILITFLIGLITAYQGALQLHQFGADLFIADLIGISITRELGPLMVAIIVAGRSGSAFTAEIGTMKVSEEIDALKIMGFDIIDFIVMPRMIAIIVAVPFIVIITNVIGILGGLVASLGILDITVSSYFIRLQEALFIRDIASGIIKSLFFAFSIGIIGCFRGFQVSGGAESVGRYTTSSVVTSIFHIILIDALFTLLFPLIGL